VIRTSLAIVLLTGFVGCAEAPGKPIPLEEVPASILKTSQEKLPDVKFDRATKRADGSYEISGKDKKGKVRDVELTADGVVTEVE
jgi:hypothetical protein